MMEEKTNQMMRGNIFKDILFGVATGDALGVPFEFKSREMMKRFPAIDMVGYGTHNMPAGTWSDDSSLTFCLAEAMTGEMSLEGIASNFIRWFRSNYWTPRGDVFDIGITTKHAIFNLEQGMLPEMAGGYNENENGNGSLMRILPLLGYLMDKSIEERFSITSAVSSITHRHIRSVIACFYYLEYARSLLLTNDKFDAYFKVQRTVPIFLKSLFIESKEIDLFKRLFHGDISKLSESEIESSGYVLHTLESSLWCLLSTSNYRDAVLKAVNLGEDTDTTAAVTGGLAGILYGYPSIPQNWIGQLARREDIEDLTRRLYKKFMLQGTSF